MKLTQEIEYRYDGGVVDAARKIAKEREPPLWLLIALTRFGHRSPDIPSMPNPKDIAKRMHDAAVYLEKWLPIYRNLPYGLQCPDDVAVVLDALPRIRKDLERLAKSRGRGKPPKMDRRICAGVVVEAWRLCHGEVEHRSEDLYQACEAYRVACGEALGPGGDIEKWRRHVEKALDIKWIREVMAAVRNSV